MSVHFTHPISRRLKHFSSAKAITFQPMMETKVNFAIPDPLTNVLVEPHKDLDPDLHLMDGITESYTINGANFLSIVIANFSHLPIIVNKSENVGTYTVLPPSDIRPLDACLTIANNKPALLSTNHVKLINLSHIPSSFSCLLYTSPSPRD